jgi:hypothetical protein
MNQSTARKLAIAVVAGLAVTACTTSKHNHPGAIAKRGVVTIQMAMVGDPGNPSVGVVQTFGGPKGDFVDPPKNTGIYKNCSDAPKAPPPCLTVGSVGYTYGIGEFETTVSQYVTFLTRPTRAGRIFTTSTTTT